MPPAELLGTSAVTRNPPGTTTPAAYGAGDEDDGGAVSRRGLGLPGEDDDASSLAGDGLSDFGGSDASSVAGSVASLASLGAASAAASARGGGRASSVASRALHGGGGGPGSVASSIVSDTSSAAQALVSSGAFSHRSTLDLGGDVFGRAAAGTTGRGDAASGAGVSSFHRRLASQQEGRLRQAAASRRDKVERGERRREEGLAAAAASSRRVVRDSAEEERRCVARLAEALLAPPEREWLAELAQALRALGLGAEAAAVEAAAASLDEAAEAAARGLPPRAEDVLLAEAVSDAERRAAGEGGDGGDDAWGQEGWADVGLALPCEPAAEVLARRGTPPAAGDDVIGRLLADVTVGGPAGRAIAGRRQPSLQQWLSL